MRVVIAIVLAFATTQAAMAGPITDFFFNYQEPQLPVGGDCSAIAGQVGPDATWYGEFAGQRVDDYTDRVAPFSARGCFRDEYDCRVWQNVAISYIGRGNIVATSCREGHRRSW